MIMIKFNCDYCNQSSERNKKDYNKVQNHYCSKSCANRGQPKRSSEGSCKKCGTPIPTKRRYCDNCWKERAKNSAIRSKINSGPFNSRYGIIDNVTVGEIIKDKDCNRKFRPIRSRAQTLYSKKRIPCQVCGYKLHTEICHIKAICDFPVTALVSEVNAINNIAFLCKNCHWELDHGLLLL